ncbi:MAG: c-type cytochrome, partial [Planctomycetales bacterium]|nr:c-type cytochrome [Planctomycetales bacterium]
LVGALAGAEPRLASALLRVLVDAWPSDRVAHVDDKATAGLSNLMTRLPLEARGDVLRLAENWHAGDLKSMMADHQRSLLKVASDAEQDQAKRLDAAAALIRMNPRDDASTHDLLALLDAQTSSELVTGLLEATAQSRSDNLGAELIDAYARLLPAGRALVLESMLSQPGTTSALLDALAAGDVEIRDLSLEQMAALRAHPDEALRQRAAELLAQGGATPSANRQQVLEDLLHVTQEPGDADRGRALFTKNCAVCHTHSGVGATIGPDLTGMFVHPKKDILTNIIDPSRDVEGNYRAYSVIAGGKVYTGLIASESRTNVIVVDAQAHRHVIERAEIDEMYSANKSLMPEGFEKELSEQDLADVLEFLAQKQQFVPLPVIKVATASSVWPNFGRRRGPDPADSFEWKPRRVNDVPFTLVDPQQGAVRNLIMLQNGQRPSRMELPSEVKLVCGHAPKTLHLLSGVSLFGFPNQQEQTTTLLVRLNYADGQSEEHELKNGVHFSDYFQRSDVPESEFAFAIGNRQMRYLKITPQRDAKIVDIDLVCGEGRAAPVVLAVTAELP